MIWAYIPPPPFRDLFHIGPLEIHMYSLLMVASILVALWWSARRVRAAGGDIEAFESIGLIAIVCGIVGARVYHVITEHARYFGPGRDPLDALKVWNGGLSVIGAIIGGGLGLWVVCRIKGINTGAVIDCIAPTVLVAQAIGRVGNYFNQEAFGTPTTLPWGLQVQPAALLNDGLGSYIPSGCDVAVCPNLPTFHPTFLYEGLWNVLGCVLLLWAVRHFKLQNGKVMCLYVLWYSFGRFFIELIRIDPVNTIGGVRINNWTDGIIFVVALAVLIYLMRRFPGHVELPLAGMGDKWHGVAADTNGDAASANDDATKAEGEEAPKVEKDQPKADEPTTDTEPEKVDEPADAEPVNK
ncbi:MAG: prolipoprotein diacylglyceryl transferase [Propionibacteriaceae bacterium]|nr:prolipoprotein diacylglyceryl transferase [Propionibacteriaceae bacterium]